MDDLISRQAAIEAIGEKPFAVTGDEYDYEQGLQNQWERDVVAIKILPPAQPRITDEQAIEHLRSTGWMQNHDREMYDMGLKKQLADDSGSYDSLLPSAQAEQAVKDCRNCKHGKYNDYHDTYFCYNAEDCSNWDKWETSAQPDSIRCRECTHHKDEIPGMVYCPTIVGGWVSEDCFCSYAERRTDEHIH